MFNIKQLHLSGFLENIKPEGHNLHQALGIDPRDGVGAKGAFDLHHGKDNWDG